MSTIRCVYFPDSSGVARAPGFPATDQHPDAVRYLIGAYYVDAIGGEPTQAEIDVVLGNSPDAIQGKLTVGVQEHLDSVARAHGYDSIFTAVTYADAPEVPKFQTEGQALRSWRSNVWATCYSYMADVQTGVRPIPTKEQLIAALPAPPVLP